MKNTASTTNWLTCNSFSALSKNTLEKKKERNKTKMGEGKRSVNPSYYHPYIKSVPLARVHHSPKSVRSTCHGMIECFQHSGVLSCAQKQNTQKELLDMLYD